MKISDTLSPSYDELMSTGIRQLNAGPDFLAAAKTFVLAVNSTKDRQQRADAQQQLGLAYTKAGKLKKAEQALNCAAIDAIVLGNEVQDADIKRDRAWVYLMRYQRNPLARFIGKEHLEEANDLLLESWEILSRLDEFEKAAVSQSYLGRIQVLASNFRTATIILDDMEDEIVSGESPNPTYLLNLRMWRLRATQNKAERRLLLQDILPLIEQTGQTSRYLEIKVIMFGGERLYRVLQWIPAPVERLIRKILGK
ncbi:MAG: hypothetical protein WAO28_04175 [Candidatus Microsaccharimonas sp.]